MERKREEKKKNEEGRREEEENPSLELMFGNFVWIYWLGNYPNSFFVYVWVRKTQTLQYMHILVGLSQFWGWF